MESLRTISVCTQVEREGQAIRRLIALRPHNVGTHKGILWNTNGMRSHIRHGLEETGFARTFVMALRQTSWFKGQRIASFLKVYCNVTSSSVRRKGNARRNAKRG